ncbi:MAG: RNA 2',3'-cyclic phosphodiesterase [Gammaproteobacteria bacterium]|nr:RNA 2',3'-cyclic phosphodiesterase [Gammaproteobacteria bacterium]
MDKVNTRRVFFALWPDDGVRQKVIETFNQSPQSKLKGRLMRPENIHITLHFIGNVLEEKLDCLDQAAQTVTVDPFELSLDCYGYFYKARVFWMGCQVTPDPLKKLYTKLGNVLSPCDYDVNRRPYAAHLTLMRKLNKPGEFGNFAPIHWRVNNFVLVESIAVEHGVEYQVIKRY